MRHVILLICLLSSLALHAQVRWMGGDISLYLSYQSCGTVYRDSVGQPVNLLYYARQLGWNMMRVRLFVDPANAPTQNKKEGVCQDLPYVIQLCKEIKESGLSIMLDLHYSDTWADPAKQFTPRRWKSLKAAALSDSVYSYTTNVLHAMKDAGVEPDMIQVGNEITFGMLWPVGKVDPEKDHNWNVLAKLLKAGCRACREVCPKAKIIIHTEHAQDWAATKGYYERLSKYKVDYDVIGLSYYPMWQGTVAHLGTVLNAIDTTLHKPVMILETAAYYSHDHDKWVTTPRTEEGGYEVSIKGQRQFTAELVDELNKHNNVIGLFWWYPEENACGNQLMESWLNRGLFNNENGCALPALYELSRFMPQSSIETPHKFNSRDLPQYSAYTLIIFYDAEVGAEPLLRALTMIKAQVIYQYTNFHGLAITKPTDMTIEETIAYLEHVKGVLQVSRDAIYQLQ